MGLATSWHLATALTLIRVLMGCNVCQNEHSQLACTICPTVIHSMFNMHAQYVCSQHAYIHSMSIHRMSMFHAGIDLYSM